jgi:hypothetical protein
MWNIPAPPDDVRDRSTPGASPAIRVDLRTIPVMLDSRPLAGVLVSGAAGAGGSVTVTLRTGRDLPEFTFVCKNMHG